MRSFSSKDEKPNTQTETYLSRVAATEAHQDRPRKMIGSSS